MLSRFATIFGRWHVAAAAAAAVAVAGLVASPPASAQAGTITFAQYRQVEGGTANPFILDSSFDGTTLTGSTNVSFSYLNLGSLGVPQGPIDALLTLTATSTSPATTDGISDFQAINSAVLSIHRLGDDANLLTAVFNGRLSGLDGGEVAGLQASSNVNTITFSSDFLNFDGTARRGVSLSFTSVSPAFQIAQFLNGLDSRSFIDDFNAAGTGTFSATADGIRAVPEPSSALLGAIGLTGLAGWRLRRRLRSTTPA